MPEAFYGRADVAISGYEGRENEDRGKDQDAGVTAVYDIGAPCKKNVGENGAEELSRYLRERHFPVILDICEGAGIAAAEELDVLIEGHEEMRGGEDVLEDDDGEADPVASCLGRRAEEYKPYCDRQEDGEYALKETQEEYTDEQGLVRLDHLADGLSATGIGRPCCDQRARWGNGEGSFREGIQCFQS